MSQLAIGVNYNIPETVDEMMKKQYQYMRLFQMQAAKNNKSMQASAYTSLKSLLADFQTQTTNLNNAFNTVAYQATSSDTSIISTTTVNNNSVATGSHSINVTQLAVAQRYVSGNQFSSNSNALGISETMVFTNNVDGSKNFSIAVNSTDTLGSIRDKINAGNDMGVSASIVASTSGGLPVYNLVLAMSSGTENAVTVTGDTAFSFSQSIAAKDATFTFDNLSVVRSSNVITDVLDGLNFSIANIGSATINISPGGNNVASTVQNAIQSMLTSYNKLITFLDGNKTVTYYDDVNKLHSSSYIDSFSFIKSRLVSPVSKFLGGTGDIQILHDLGIINDFPKDVPDQYDRDKFVNSFGSLVIDGAKKSEYGNDTLLAYKLKTDFNAVKDFFTNSTSGFIFNMNDVIDNSINASDSTGIITNATAALTALQKNNDLQIDNEKKRLAATRELMIDRFSQLNVIISSYQNISNFLDRQNDYLSGLLRGKN